MRARSLATRARRWQSLLTSDRPAKRVFLIVILATLAFESGRIFNFNFAEETWSTSTAIAVGIWAPWYDMRFPAARQAAERIGIVMIDDDGLPFIGDRFPIPYDRQARMISEIIRPSGAPDTPPVAVFMDFLYATNRHTLSGGRRPSMPIQAVDLQTLGADMDYLAEELALNRRDGQIDTDVADAMGALSPPLLVRRAGVLVADQPVALRQATRPQEARPHERRNTFGIVNQLAVPAAPGMFLTPPLRYALAPDGLPSPALLLMIWSCAVEAGLPGCSLDEPAVSVREIRAAARAAAIADVAGACAHRIDAEVRAASHAADRSHRHGRAPAFDPAIVDRLVAHCRDIAYDHAANAGWVPDPPASAAIARTSMALLPVYAAARRDGRFAGALEGLICLDRLDSDAAPGHMLAHPPPVAVTIARLRQASADCHRRSDDMADDRIGPTMTVLWGAGTDDGGPPRDATPADRLAFRQSGQAAAPYAWAEVDHHPVEDVCAPFRLSRDILSRLSESSRLLAFTLYQGENTHQDLCAYHRTVRVPWLSSTHDRTRAYVASALSNRVVILGATVSGAEDLHPMRGVYAPGAWAHAMALDNLLAMGRAYRPGALDGVGFSAGTGYEVARLMLQTLLAGLIALGLHNIVRPWQIEARVHRNLPGWIAPTLPAVLVDVVVAGFATSIPSLLVALILLTLLPILPLDWIAVAAFAATAWIAAGDGSTNPSSSR
ncbi:CHASE2 domain-containing protein (plasmid) [Tistrella mobilis]|uniref:hypothetical protein n=1 Tax=Tistrella mobilis TaxID=171437 RepID=UPI003557B94D